MSKKNLVILFSFLLLFFASGCAPDCKPDDYPGFLPILQSPTDGSVIDYDNPPAFNWTHNESCKPYFYHVYMNVVGATSEYYNPVNAEYTNFNRLSPFQPGTQYEWYVRALGAGESSLEDGPPSETWTFTTDGFCSSAELEPPILLKPEYGSWLGEATGPGPASVELAWEYPGDCHPESFHYQLATDPEFSNIITSGITDWNDYNQMVSVPRCARIYWRVEARKGNSSGGYSDPSRFTYASISSCFQNRQSIDASLIKGYVFEDYCAATVPWVPEGVGIAPPCVFGEPYGVHANGVRARVELENEMTREMDPAEIGIPGVVVDLGAGPCPSTGLDQFTTVQNGNYYFMVQSPGEYCVSVDKAKNPSLDHGIWTLPLTDQDVTESTITFSPAEDLSIQNFGWDKNDFLKIDFSVDLTSFCRFGDSKDHLAIAEVPAGAVIPIYARNVEATWFATYVDGIRCFISVASGTPNEDPEELLIFPRQPDPSLPRPTAVPASRQTISCSSYSNPDSCRDAGCYWFQVNDKLWLCTPYQ